MFENVKNWRVRPGRTMRDPKGGLIGSGVILPSDHPAVTGCPNISDYCVPLDDAELPEEFAPTEEYLEIEVELEESEPANEEDDEV